MGFIPFRDGDTFATFRKVTDDVIKEIRSLENEYVLNVSQIELENYYVDKVVLDPLILHTDEYYIEKQSSTKIDVSNDFRRAVFPGERAFVQGTRLDLAIPYEGTAILWRIRPSAFTLCVYPEIEIKDGIILLSIIFPDDAANSKNIRSDIDEAIKSLLDAVNNLNRDVQDHNKSASGAVRTAINHKKELATSAIGAVASLDIPMKRSDHPSVFSVPVKRRKSPINKPKVATDVYRPEPILEEEEYQYILNILRSMSLVIERSPTAFNSLNEEAIRTHFLLQLNGHYEGSATGETFNASGKTDILIRVDNKNVFIAECKFWSGPKAFLEAVDQLLGYLSWRDAKCALLIFNKTKDSSAVREKMHATMESHSGHVRTISNDKMGDSRYVFVKESDPGKEIIITTQLYDIL